MKILGPIVLAATSLLLPAVSAAQSEMKCEMHAKHAADSHDAMNRRGDEGMGFSQSKTTHHFLLSSEGGSIVVDANDTNDTASRDAIRMHLAHIAEIFSAGDFGVPLFVHAQLPPGVTTMKRLKNSISYKFTPTAKGGAVRIMSQDANALDAIHDFLRFQIEEHQTGDPLEVAQ